MRINWVTIGLCVFLWPTLLVADPIITDFEGLSDLETVATQFSPMTFSNAVVVTAGVSLNEFEFPPHSGTNVVFDNSGPISIDFGLFPAFSFGGFFTYLVPVTLEAFDFSANLLGSVTSSFSSNLALSGDPGSSPNEFLGVGFPGGIARVTITGDPAGGSFTLDDLTADVSSTPIPEPGTLSLILLGGLASARLRKRFFNR